MIVRSVAHSLAALLSAVAFWAGGALAETRISPEEFEALSTGKTLTFTRGGVYYGEEQYMSDRQVLWRYGDGSCSRGVWYPQDGSLCFLYEDNLSAQCWIFTRRAGSNFARSAGTAPGHSSELRQSGISDEPLACPAPGLGV